MFVENHFRLTPNLADIQLGGPPIRPGKPDPLCTPAGGATALAAVPPGSSFLAMISWPSVKLIPKPSETTGESWLRLLKSGCWFTEIIRDVTEEFSETWEIHC